MRGRSLIHEKNMKALDRIVVLYVNINNFEAFEKN